MRRLYPTPCELTGAPALEEEYLLPPARHVRANFVISLDGRIDIGGRSSRLGGPADRQAFMALRAVTDAVLVGAGTVRAENYGPVRLDPSVQDRRRVRDQAPLPRLAIVSARASLDASDRVFQGGDKPLLFTTAAGAGAHPDLAAVAEVVVCGEQSVKLESALDDLAARGLPRVLCEGGPTLLRSLVVPALLDELCLTISAQLIGPGAGGLLGDQPLPDAVQLGLTSLLEGDGMLLSRYRCREHR
jgi:riboflavin-specific deaminase-like protein